MSMSTYLHQAISAAYMYIHVDVMSTYLHLALSELLQHSSSLTLGHRTSHHGNTNHLKVAQNYLQPVQL